MSSGLRAVVIGAGMVGAACAGALARHGARVTVVEAGAVGGGATAAGMGHLVVMDDSPAQLALTARSLELWEELAPALPPQAAYRPSGTLWVASDDEELGAVFPKQAAYRAVGRSAELLDTQALRTLEPGLRDGLAGGLLVPGDSVVYAPAAAAFLLERSGAALLRSSVVALDERGVRLAGGERLEAELIVVAGGTGVLELLPDLPLRRRKGQLLITERGGLSVRHQLVELGYLNSAHASDADSVAFNVQPRPTGQLLIGSSRQFGQPDASIDWALLRRMLRRAQDFLPGLPGLSGLRVWSGQRCATPDHLPIVGRDPQRGNVFVATGHEGLGITTALGTAELLTAQVFGRPSALTRFDFSAARFQGQTQGAAHA